ncbi:MAG: hypothetical protein LBR31_04525 [Desulfovibrio sp.]|jgi:hypothetical protein|nr:hypothetical protein [Desulfovibrio sp.]
MKTKQTPLNLAAALLLEFSFALPVSDALAREWPDNKFTQGIPQPPAFSRSRPSACLMPLLLGSLPSRGFLSIA